MRWHFMVWRPVGTLRALRVAWWFGGVMKECSTGLCLSLSIIMSLNGLGCEPGGTSALDGEAGEAVYGEGLGALSATPAPQGQSKKPGLKPASAVKSTGTAVRAADVFEKQPEKSSGKVVLTFK
jgi:hypothetical protein